MESSAPAFLQSLTIIGREGLEAMLLLGAMLAVLRKAGAGGRAAGLWWGAGLAIAASLVTGLVFRSLTTSAGNVEVLEGLTMLAAAAVLLFVGHWLLAKADAKRWRAYLEARIRGAAGARSLSALGLVAFLAVYREGVETVLFYAALLADETASRGAVLAGFVAGLALLGLLCHAIYRFGVRVPLRPFFMLTSALLLLLAFVFSGKGVHELQEGGILGETALVFPRLRALGVYPTVETLAAQAALLLAIAGPVLYRWVRDAGAARRASRDEAAPAESHAV